MSVTTASVAVTEVKPTFLTWIPWRGVVEGTTVTLNHSFADAAGDVITGAYTTNWGDGTINTSLTHVYAEDSASYGGLGSRGYRVATTASTTDTGGSYATVSSACNVAVGDAPLTAGSALPNLLYTAGLSFTTEVGHFTDSNPSATASDFAQTPPTITWGDSMTSLGWIIADPNGGFDEMGMHTYATDQNGAGLNVTSITSTAITDFGSEVVQTVPLKVDHHVVKLASDPSTVQLANGASGTFSIYDNNSNGTKDPAVSIGADPLVIKVTVGNAADISIASQGSDPKDSTHRQIVLKLIGVPTSPKYTVVINRQYPNANGQQTESIEITITRP